MGPQLPNYASGFSSRDRKRNVRNWGGCKAFAGQGKAYTDEARVNELERMVGRLTMENDFLKKLLKTFQNEV